LLKAFVFIFLSFFAYAGNVQAKISVEKIYNTLDFPFELSAYGFHDDMKTHLAELIEGIDDVTYSQNVAKLFIHNSQDLIHKVGMLMVNFMNIENVEGFEETAKDLQALVRKAWVLDDNLRATSAIGSKEDFQVNITTLYNGLDQFILLNLSDKEQRIIRAVTYAKRVICGIEDAILAQHLQIIPSLFQED